MPEPKFTLITWIVPTDLAGERIDRALTHLVEVQSRSRAAKLIESGRVRLDGREIKASRSVRGGESVEIQLPIEQPTTLNPLPLSLEILFEDADILVVNKPAGLVVHPAAGHAQDTLVNALIHHAKDLSMGFGEQRPGIVHRLDKDTSGVLVVAKNDPTQAELVRQFKARSVHRVYWAIVLGEVQSAEGRIESFLRRHPIDRKRFASGASGKVAITKFRRKAVHREGLSLLECRLETGRTHQIRVHMAESGHPVVGDNLYGSKARQNRIRSRALKGLILSLNRIGLHAAELGFRHPRTEMELKFLAPWPQDLLPLIEHLGWQ